MLPNSTREWELTSRHALEDRTLRAPISRLPVGRRSPLPDPRDQVGAGWIAAEFAQPRRVLPAMIVAVHCYLRQPLAHGEFKRRTRKPRNADPALQRRFIQRPDARQHLVVAYRKVLQSEWCEVPGLA